MPPEAAAGIIRSKAEMSADYHTKYEPIKKVYVEMVKQVVESEGVNENTK